MNLGLVVYPDTTVVLLKENNLRCFQTCMGSPVSLPSYDILEEYKSMVRLLSPSYSVVHSTFLINPAVVDNKKWSRAKGMLKFSLGLAKRAGFQDFVLHAGSGSASRLVETMQLLAPAKPRILLENDAGGGKRIGSLRLMASVRDILKGKVGLCFDTAHSFARGTTKDLGALKRAYDHVKPDLIHLNDPDPEVELGSCLDRHKVPLGDGRFGEDILKFACWVGDRTPMILEQPIEAALEGVKRLREYGRSR